MLSYGLSMALHEWPYMVLRNVLRAAAYS